MQTMDSVAATAPDQRSTATEPEQLRRTFAGLVLAGCIPTAAVFYLLLYWWRLPAVNNFFTEAWPSYHALNQGHLVEFLRLGPQYIGSLVLRAPFELLSTALGGGPRAAYFATGLPCLLSAPVLGAWLSLRPRRRVAHGFFSRVSPIVLCVFNPVVAMALIIGHPEDILGAVLCVAAVILASEGSGGWSGLLTGLAVANKPWALVVVPVVLVALPRERRRAILTMGLSAAVILVPAFLAREQGAGGSGAVGAVGSFGSNVHTIFLRPQLLWWFGPNAWIVHDAHVLIVVAAAVSAGIWWLARGRRATTNRDDEILLLLVMVMLLRSSLDPWDNVYYHVPFVFALMAYEARRTPWLTFVYSCLLIVVVPPILLHNADLNAAAYSVVAGGTLLVLAGRLFLPDRLQNLGFLPALSGLGVRAPSRQPEPSA
jgi:hypothetical protein